MAHQAKVVFWIPEGATLGTSIISSASCLLLLKCSIQSASMAWHVGKQCPRLRASGPGITPPNRPPPYASTATSAYSSAPGIGGEGNPPSICILGGGFGGLYTAIRLESLMWPKHQKPRITLVDQNDRFVFKPLLYDLLTKTASEDEVAPEYSTLLAPYNVCPPCCHQVCKTP